MSISLQFDFIFFVLLDSLVPELILNKAWKFISRCHHYLFSTDHLHSYVMAIEA